MASMSAPAGENKRYDRQIRIWGVHGQIRLQGARICVLGAGPVAAETLKNLVLGGIASFTVVDAETVSSRDIGNNFFYTQSILGRGRAECMTDLIRELNDSVHGSYTDSELEHMVHNTPEFFKQFTILIATQMKEDVQIKLESICMEFGVILLVVQCLGPFGTLRISAPEVCIVESKPESTVHDLRLAQPWPGLLAYANSINLQTCDDIVHKHIPFAVILLKAMHSYAEQAGKAPGTAAERRAFKDHIRKMQRSVQGVPVEEENFQEAIGAAHIAWSATNIPLSVQAVLQDPKIEVDASSHVFWILAAALRRFVEKEGKGALPLEGSIPDMTATTELYLQIQRVYRDEAERHCSIIFDRAKQLLVSLGRDASEISMDDVRLLCKNSRNLSVVRFRTLAEEYSAETCKASVLRTSISADAQCSEAAIYLALRAADRFHAKHDRVAGSTHEVSDKSWEEDIELLRQCLVSVVSEVGVSVSSIPEELLVDICRCSGNELHCTAAIMGGMAAQEAIKVIMKQFVPVSGTLVYNGVHSASAVLNL